MRAAYRLDIMCPVFSGGGYLENSVSLKHLDAVSLDTVSWQFFVQMFK